MPRGTQSFDDHLANFDRKVEVVENALYRLKERDYVEALEVRALDDLLGTSANLKVDLYDLIRFHEGPTNA